MKQRINSIYGVLFTLALLALVVLLLSHSGVAAGMPVEVDPTPLSPDDQLEQIQMQLQSDQLSDLARTSLEEKLSMAEQMAEEQDAGAQAPRDEKSAPPLPAAIMKNQPEPVVEGIFEGSQGLVRPSMASIENVWQAERNGTLLQVFAGALPDNPQQGIILVVQMSDGEGSRNMVWVQTPKESGALRIIEAQETQLVLSAVDESVWYFNLDTFAISE